MYEEEANVLVCLGVKGQTIYVFYGLNSGYQAYVASAISLAVSIFVFETGSSYLAILQLTTLFRLALNLQSSTCLCLQSTGIKGIYGHARPLLVNFNTNHTL